MKKIFYALILISSFSLVGCPENSNEKNTVENSSPNSGTSDAPSNGDYAATRDGLQALDKEIMNLIQDKSCSVNSDCAVVALGSRACGGPERYEAYAPKNTNQEQLQNLASKLEVLNKTYNKENQMVSICSMVMKPGVQCVANQCKAVAATNLIQ